jgi:glycosyltransferase involved in cell wall biosynthesis
MASTSVIEDVRSCKEGDTPALSVVVIGRNEGARLERCLESVRVADYPRQFMELIYVDSGSTDGSCALAERLGARVVQNASDRPCAAAARNAGSRAARFDLVHFLDGDTLVETDWLRTAVRVMHETGAACVFGRRVEIDPRKSLYMRVASLEWYVPPGPASFCGGDALFRRHALEAVGGFNESFIAGEEPELCYRLHRRGFSIWRSDEPMTQHDLDITRFRQYWRRAVRSGWAYAVVGVTCRAGKERVWRGRNLANVLDVSAWVGLVVAAVFSSDWRILLALAGLVAARVIWIGRGVRPRVAGWGDALLYGIHCQFARLPILVGQIRGLWYLLRRRPARLIEYKD